MATNRSLATLLRALQQPSSKEDASRLLRSAATLLTFLLNPLNLTLLSSQLLTAPAIWRNPESLQTSFHILSVVTSAALQLLRNENNSQQSSLVRVAPDGIDRVGWARAVSQGADHRSPKWKHLLILGGLLVGFESQGRHGLPGDSRAHLEASIVDTANAALTDQRESHELAAGSTCMVLGHVLNLLQDAEKRRLRHDLLLPILGEQLFKSGDGLENGYFLGIADKDIRQVAGQRFNWSQKSASFYQLQKLANRPLISALGPMSQLMACCVDHVFSSGMLLKVVDDIAAFTRSLMIQWRQNKLSEIDISEEMDFLDQETRLAVLPLLWQVLRSTMFAVVIIQRSLLARVMRDPTIPMAQHPFIAVQVLQALRSICFISSRLGHNALSQYNFTYMSAIDVLSDYPAQAEALLIELRSKTFGRISAHPNDRNHDLFFLNTAEHFTRILTQETNQDLVLQAARPYLETENDPRLIEIFEAAHSVVLSVFAAPQNYEIVDRQSPFYISVLLANFPRNLSPRQFRLAVKTMVKIASHPSPVLQHRPLLASAILEAIHIRFQACSETPLPTPKIAPAVAPWIAQDSLSEKAVTLLAIIDSLSVLAFDVLEEWLPIASISVSDLTDVDMRETCKKRFWEVVSNGEMDLPRAEVCVAWWNNRGGRSEIMDSGTGTAHGPRMSGALPEISKL